MSAINYKDPPVEIIPSPVALDYEILQMQQKLAGVAWLQKIFGRAHLQPQPPQSKPQQQKYAADRADQMVPEVYYKRSPYDARPNDNLSAYCFFFCKDPVSFTDYKALDAEQLVEQPLSVYFWANLKKVDGSKSYDFGPELELDAFNALRKYGNFSIDRIWRTWDQVFRPFTITETFKQYLKPPYAAFRIDGVLRYDFSKQC